jgi:ferrous iron transport protein B
MLGLPNKFKKNETGELMNKLVAIAGNPNAGKTSIFNGLTGARQHVGNYPGVTVEVKRGTLFKSSVSIVDLPGTYSFTPYSDDEKVALELILNDHPDLIVNVVDSSNLERNLYLTIQLIEMGIPMVLDLNMQDLAQKRGWVINTRKLSKRLSLDVIETIGSTGRGLGDLVAVIKNEHAPTISQKQTKHFTQNVNEALDRIQNVLLGSALSGNVRWLAVRVLEGDSNLGKLIPDTKALSQAIGIRKELQAMYPDSLETELAHQRYAYIQELCSEVLQSSVPLVKTLSERVDSVVLNKYIGIPIFLLMMYGVFQLTFTLGEPLMEIIERFFGRLGASIGSLWPEGSESMLQSLLVDGIIGGVGGVLVFLPNIFLLFLAISVLEDTGYMARAAFIMDRFMNKIGLHGKSFIPMLIGFGCSVPAIMATRTLENKRDRLVTMLVVPLMSCGARLPIYALLIPAFFPSRLHAPILWIIYLIGIVLAILSARLLRVTMFKGETMPFLMEVPPYHLPTIKGTLLHMWERGKLYIQKAGTLILGLSILLWALSSFPKLSEERSVEFDQQFLMLEQSDIPDSLRDAQLFEIENILAEAQIETSVIGRMGRFIEPALMPMGFDWKIGTAMIGAFAAKEVFVSSLGIVFSVGEADQSSETLRSKLKDSYDPLIAFCIMLFALISAPCMATIAITKRESNSWRWAMFQLVGLTMLAYVLTSLVYQLGRLAGL